MGCRGYLVGNGFPRVSRHSPTTYWIDEETRIVTREVEWKDGVEVSGRDLVDGWYTRFFTVSSFLFYTNG